MCCHRMVAASVHVIIIICAPYLYVFTAWPVKDVPKYVFTNQIYIDGMADLCFDCRIVTSSNTSRLEAHAGFFRLLLIFMCCDLLTKS